MLKGLQGFCVFFKCESRHLTANAGSGTGTQERFCACAQVKARGKPAEDDVSIAAHLLRLRDPERGTPLPDDLLAGEFGLFFSAGIESAGNAISWTL